MIRLHATAVVPDRPFTRIESTKADLRVMNRMIERLRRHVAGLPVAGRGVSRDDRISDPSDQGIHRIVVTDVARAGEPRDLVLVGFFGHARSDVDHGPIVDLESTLIEGMADAANPLVYYNVHWPGAGWGNLVLFTDMTAERGWGHDPRHAEAVARSPAHYHSIRLHIGILRAGLAGGTIELERTRYFDFSGPEAWTAVREMH
jgi:hypothetical protein